MGSSSQELPCSTGRATSRLTAQGHMGLTWDGAHVGADAPTAQSPVLEV